MRWPRTRAIHVRTLASLKRLSGSPATVLYRRRLGFRKARQSAERALALDDRLPEAHVAIGRVQLGFDWDFAGAETSYRRALELDPANTEALQRYGHFLQMMGRWEDAIATRRKAIDLDPLSIPVHFGLADTYFTAGRVDEALIEVNKIHELDTGYPVYHLLARIELARSDPRKALEMIGRDNITWRKLYISAIARYQLGEPERGDALLRQLVDSHGEDAGSADRNRLCSEGRR